MGVTPEGRNRLPCPRRLLMPGSGGNVVGSGGAARGSWTRHAPVLAAGRVQAGSCGSDKWKKNCLFNLANSGQGPRGSHRCPPASQWSKAHVAGTLRGFPRASPTAYFSHGNLGRWAEPASQVTGEETEAESWAGLSEVPCVTRGHTTRSYHHSGLWGG